MDPVSLQPPPRDIPLMGDFSSFNQPQEPNKGCHAATTSIHPCSAAEAKALRASITGKKKYRYFRY